MRISPFRRLSIFALPVALALSACGGATPQGPSSSNSFVPAAAARVHQADLPSELLFLSNGGGSVYIYPLKNPNASGPIAIVSGLPGIQYESTVDAKGNFYITASGEGFFDPKQYYVAKIAPPYTGKPKFLQTIWQGNTFPAVGVAVDRKGTVYVSSCGDYCTGIDSSLRGVLVYPAGSTAPKKFITLPSFDSMGTLATDTKGNVYGLTWNKTSQVANAFEIPAGTANPKLLRLRGFYAIGDAAGGIAVDTHGDVYVSNPGIDASYVLEYKPGQHEPFRQFEAGSWLTTAAYPLFLNVGPDGNLYVATACGAGNQASQKCKQVYGFHPSGAKLFETVGSLAAPSLPASVTTYPNPMLQGANQ